MIGSRVPGEALRAGRHVTRSTAPDKGPRVGVLAMQGDVLEHLRLLERAGARPVVVRGPDGLDDIDGLVLPGGESTTIGKLCDLYGITDPLRKHIGEGLPVFGTCAGAVLLSRQALRHDGAPSVQTLIGGMDVVVRRNAFGRQVASFETDLEVAGISRPVRAVFIRAPWFEETGTDVAALASVATPLGDKVVVARQGNLLASAFHPELAGDERLHRLFVESLLPRREA